MLPPTKNIAVMEIKIENRDPLVVGGEAASFSSRARH